MRRARTAWKKGVRLLVGIVVRCLLMIDTDGTPYLLIYGEMHSGLAQLKVPVEKLCGHYEGGLRSLRTPSRHSRIEITHRSPLSSANSVVSVRFHRCIPTEVVSVHLKNGTNERYVS